MTTTYVWTVTALSTMPKPTPDYVVSAQYTVTGIDGTITVSIQGTSQFAVSPDQTDFVPYANLTEAIVLGWIQEEPNLVVNIQANLDGQIESIVNPPVSPQITPLPWVSA
jgi:hypothetical protein